MAVPRLTHVSWPAPSRTTQHVTAPAAHAHHGATRDRTKARARHGATRDRSAARARLIASAYARNLTRNLPAAHAQYDLLRDRAADHALFMASANAHDLTRDRPAARAHHDMTRGCSAAHARLVASAYTHEATRDHARGLRASLGQRLRAHVTAHGRAPRAPRLHFAPMARPHEIQAYTLRP